ncbi:MAG: RluA family pseudouridine synthase [Candidatus Hydrogenedens sp.]|jgi:23S rRNA pseudouridine1911/1915/1917 synthase|nr:RluA family pseudouridine synthase [Candidatus Hydrogenedens sp.]
MPSLVHLTVEDTGEAVRLDVYLADTLDNLSRSYLKKLIQKGNVTIDGQPGTKASQLLQEGQKLTVLLPAPPSLVPSPENIPLDILHEDEHLVVVNKASGMVVHPAPGHQGGTLVNALLYHCPDYEQTGDDSRRPGIVHRLDRYTSGVMVAAKNQSAYFHLAKQAAERDFERRYLALVAGEFPEERGCINASMGRSLVDPSRMAVTGINAKTAITHFETLERFQVACLVRLTLETGRTHQIRVHMRFAGHPMLGDPVYGMDSYDSLGIDEELMAALEQLDGQALHAEKLGFTHPFTGEWLSFSSSPPSDFQDALNALRNLKSDNK